MIELTSFINLAAFGRGCEVEIFSSRGSVKLVVHRGGLILWPKNLTSLERAEAIIKIYRRYISETSFK